jgi:hypothetical protein
VRHIGVGQARHWAPVGTSGHRYRICWGTSQNIIRLETSVDGRELPVEWLCFGPRGVPIGDILLQQKIALEGDEEAALLIAGRTPVPIAGMLTPQEIMYAVEPSLVGQRLQVRAPTDHSGWYGVAGPESGNY